MGNSELLKTGGATVCPLICGGFFSHKFRQVENLNDSDNYVTIYILIPPCDNDRLPMRVGNGFGLCR